MEQGFSPFGPWLVWHDLRRDGDKFTALLCRVPVTLLPLRKGYNVTTRKGACKAMKLSASEAAKRTGKSVPTITRAIKSGKISADRQPEGGYQIDPAELFRVFPAVTGNDNATPPKLGNETPNETSILQREVEMLREMLEQERGTVADLRRRLDDEAEERRSLATRLLTDQRPQAKPGLLARLLGK